MKKEKVKNKRLFRTGFSLAGQVLIFSLLATILTAVLSFFVLSKQTGRRVSEQKQTSAAQLTDDLITTIKGYPSYEWLLTYWNANRDSLDVEYMVTDNTRKKAQALAEKYPGLVIDYERTEDVEKMSPEDQKIYAEVVYDQFVGLMNQLKDIYQPAYMSIILMNPSYTHGVFLLSGATSDQKRGSNYQDAYVIGVEADSTPEQKENMISAASGGRSLTESGNYIDSYGYVQDILDGHHIIVDVTYDISEIRSEEEKDVLNGIVLFVIFQALLALVLFLLIYFYAVRPIERIQENVLYYREKKDSRPVLENLSKIRIRNELGTLSSGISDMVVSIDQYVSEIRNITAEKEKIAAELNVAKRIQTEMLPSTFPAFPDRKEFDLYATMTPAKSVGGDFYDFFFVDQDHLALVIADVSGKGVPAALFMVNSKTRIQNQANFGKSPKEILSAVNNQLCKGNKSGFFVTVWLAIIDVTTGKGVVANAGHEYPVLRRAGEPYEALIYTHSPALGVMEDIPFTEHEFQLHPGDRIFVYTDGVPEATSSTDELFGLERMLDSLNRQGDVPLMTLLPELKKDIDQFSGDEEQFDDITMLGFDYLGPAEGVQEKE